MDIVTYNVVESKIIEIRNNKVIIDRDIAELYGVETKRINEAVKNNPEKFPEGYLFELSKEEWEGVKSKFSTSPLGGGKVKRPNAFSEKGLYMLATILKSPKAVETTLAIIETFAKVREINRTIVDILNQPEDSPKQKPLSDKVGHLVGELMMPDESDLETVSVSTTTKLKFFSMLEISKTTVKKPRNDN